MAVVGGRAVSALGRNTLMKLTVIGGRRISCACWFVAYNRSLLLYMQEISMSRHSLTAKCLFLCFKFIVKCSGKRAVGTGNRNECERMMKYVILTGAA